MAALEPNFSFRSPEYAALLARSASHAFQGEAWLDGIVSLLAPALRATPRTVTVRTSDSKRLVLVLPLVRVQRGGLSVIEFADLGASDYNQIIYDPADTTLLLSDSALPGRILDLLAPCDLVSFDKVFGEDHVFEALLRRASRATMRVSTHPLALGGTWEDWRSSTLHERFRRDQDLKRRRLSKKGPLNTTALEDEQAVRESMAQLRRFRARRFEDRSGSDMLADDAIFAFYQGVALEGVKTGAARVFRMTCGPDTIGVVFGLWAKGRFYYTIPAFDLENYRTYSVGLLMLEDVIKHCIGVGDTIFDFTIGDYGFKQQFGTEAIPLFEFHLPMSVRGRVALHRMGWMREAKRLLKPLLKRSPRLSGVHGIQPAKEAA